MSSDKLKRSCSFSTLAGLFTLWTVKQWSGLFLTLQIIHKSTNDEFYGPWQICEASDDKSDNQTLFSSELNNFHTECKTNISTHRRWTTEGQKFAGSTFNWAVCFNLSLSIIGVWEAFKKGKKLETTVRSSARGSLNIIWTKLTLNFCFYLRTSLMRRRWLWKSFPFKNS